MFSASKFIKADYEKPLAYGQGDYSPIFFKKFNCNKSDKRAILSFCALGLGYAYINGKAVSTDLFCAPVSDYRKTLWYSTYDVTDLITSGDNILTVIVGNGFYNESFPSAWNFDNAKWRDCPKLIAELVLGDEVLVATDDSWGVVKNSFITFNQYRSGEIFDARLYEKDWQTTFINKAKKHAVIDDNPPIGELLPYMADPVREIEEYLPVKIIDLGDGKVTVDFGVNLSGYVGVNAIGNCGDVITLKHAEEIDENGNLQLNGLDCYAKTVPFQTCQVICGNTPVFYKPKFTYFGFRFVQITGLTQPIEKYQISAYRVGNTANRVGFFECSDEFLNRLYSCAVNSIQSNMVYNLTDCPTREKLGWTNDAATSTEHIYYLTDCRAFFEKWMRDITDTMKEDGSLSGIAPSPDWGYGYGPVCDLALFEIPYQDYLFTGSDKLLKKHLPYYEKYLAYLSKKREEGYQFILADWMGCGNTEGTSVAFVTDVLETYFYKIFAIAKKTEESVAEFERRLKALKDKYLNENGECVEGTQSAVSMLVYFGFHSGLAPLKAQLKKAIEDKDFHLDVGLLGNKYIWLALDTCDLNDYAFKLIKAKGMPSFDFWLSDGATSLYENWTKTGTVSENHHMYSAFNVFNYKILGGIRLLEPIEGRPQVEIKPYFASEIDFVNCQTEICGKAIKVLWKRESDKIRLEIVVEKDLTVYYKGEKLFLGNNVFYE